jgi:hypothetical protein
MDIRRHNVVIRTKWLFTPTGTEQLRWDWKVVDAFNRVVACSQSTTLEGARQDIKMAMASYQPWESVKI